MARWNNRLRLRLRSLFGKASVEQELTEELRFHLEKLVEQNRADGRSPAEARSAALREFGGVEQVKEECRDARGLQLLESVLQDLRYALRMLRKSPGFAAVAVLTLALGIGANTAVFSVIRAVLLQSLPFPDPSRIVIVRGTVAGQPTGSISYPDYLDCVARSRSFERLGAYTDSEFILNAADHSERLLGEVATDSYFDALRVAPLLGRAFSPRESRMPASRPVVVISFGLWRRLYGGDRAVLGKQLRVNGDDYTIIGVMPHGFRGLSDKADAWLPVVMRDALWPQTAKFDILHGRDDRWLRMVGRLRPGVTRDRAQSELDGIAASLRAVFPKFNRDRGFLVREARDVFIGAARKPLFLLLGAVSFVLLIGCANVVSLMLARLTSRKREFAMRAALGAPPGRLARQVFTECLLLALIGAAAALGLVYAGMPALVSVLPISFPSYASVRVDREVLGFTLFLVFVSTALLALLPARAVARRNLNESLSESARAVGGARSRQLNSVLVISEVALATALLAGAGLLLKSFSKLLGDDPGFRPDRLLTMRFYVPDRLSGEARNRFGPQLADYVSRLPGVDSAAVTFIDPFLWGGFGRGFTLEDHQKLSTSEQDSITYQEVGPGYFRTIGTPVLRGREFTWQDALSSPRAVMVNDSFARRFWPGQNPLGKRIKYGVGDSKPPAYPWMQVIGVVKDAKFETLRQDPSESPVVYAALLQSEAIVSMSIIVRTKANPAAMIPQLRQEIERHDPSLPLYNIAALEDRMLADSADARSYALLLALFAALGLCLCAIGIYGVIAFWVAQRTPEIGVRLAMGASRTAVMRMVACAGLRLTLAGILLGVSASLALMRILGSLLYEVRPFDPEVFAAMAALLTAVALVACWLPARRAMQVDPVTALRHE